ncbi:MAG TPA: thiamine phosphate synthase, partial [Elusimicrobiota bacterium]|nr:thiamine phosphate synthase [Elusimicrobiota bacterium]
MTAIERFQSAKLYVITCPPAAGPDGYAAMVDAACQGGADVVQFRDKTLSAKERFAVARRLVEICRANGALFIVNDAIDSALMAG